MFSAVVLSAALLAGAVQAVTINTPSAVTQCQPAMLTWGQGTAPYYISIIPGNQPSAAALESFPTQTGTSMTWNVALAAGTSITVKIVDSTGETNYSDAVTVQAGSETTCSASGAAAVAPAASSSSSSDAAASSSLPVAVTTSLAAPSRVRAASSSASTSSSSTSSSSSESGPSHKATSAASSAASAVSSAIGSARSSAASGIAGAAAAASSSTNTSGATALKAGTSLLAAAALFALVA